MSDSNVEKLQQEQLFDPGAVEATIRDQREIPGYDDELVRQLVRESPPTALHLADEAREALEQGMPADRAVVHGWNLAYGALTKARAGKELETRLLGGQKKWWWMGSAVVAFVSWRHSKNKEA